MVSTLIAIKVNAPTIKATGTPLSTATGALATQLSTETKPSYINKSATNTPLPMYIFKDVFLSDIAELNLKASASSLVIDNNNMSDYVSNYGTTGVEIVPDCSRTGNYGVRLNYIYKPDSLNMLSWGVSTDGSLIDTNNYQAIELWVKGTVGEELFSVGIATYNGLNIYVESNKYIEVSPIEWQLIYIPFSDFKDAYSGTKNVPNLIYGIDIAFDSVRNTTSEIICVDDIRFVPQ